MKFIHLADLHIGKIVKDFSMIEDQRYILKQIISAVKKEKADAVLISGDVYDRTIPPEDAVQLFDDFIYELSEIPVKVMLISGNHDSDERLNFGSRLFVEKQVFFSTKYDGKLHKQVFEDEYGPVNFFFLPFVKSSQVKHFFPDEKIENYDQAVRVAIASEKINKKERNVIMAHQFVVGKNSEVMLGGSESPSVANVGLVEAIGYDCFKDFDYVALGHIHKGQKIGRDGIRYAGTPLKYHADEVNDEKSVPVITLGKKGDVNIKLRPLKPLRDMRSIKGKLNQLLSPENIKNPNDYIFVTLTDEDVVNDAMTIIRQTYPNTMQIRYDNSHTNAIVMVDPSQIVEMRSFPELVSDFYQKMYGVEISDEELVIMKKLARKVGIEDETN